MLRPQDPTAGLDGEACVPVTEPEVDLYNVPALQEALLSAVRRGALAVIDLVEATFIDSTALGALVRAARQARPGSVRVACANPDIVRIFELTRIDRLVPVYDTVADALAGGRPARRG